MRICFPVCCNIGLDSLLFDSFSCAPEYVIADTKSMKVITVSNIGQILQYGTCDPVEERDGFEIDIAIIKSIGDALLHKLNSVDISVFQAQREDVGGNINMLLTGNLVQLISDKGYQHIHV
ncbi:dinitrogenase iron-molybdenum cofactor biosynthesis protein [Denitrovibrio acetiphilus DSM 12809]|uniref:Dinitrogenase iron-molybdenum cofactor biosynthesis protein n=1 Tax=Denitrovibrio acetiphilus (strain DSM 12809 / NBRC 114555 / N2460) TaxID=522772 RepID=D4H670_DENA2|nr:NifB/NifX family molybdenum-iron cluster-binding protein [Denitrovibrio acetiphilus]ADD67716.1 dinitrogenase iron-molybdenum cofactor biosynthesis protein [Denitrovibrio acetiphilus DSM 12809]